MNLWVWRVGLCALRPCSDGRSVALKESSWASSPPSVSHPVCSAVSRWWLRWPGKLTALQTPTFWRLNRLTSGSCSHSLVSLTQYEQYANGIFKSFAFRVFQSLFWKISLNSFLLSHSSHYFVTTLHLLAARFWIFCVVKFLFFSICLWGVLCWNALTFQGHRSVCDHRQKDSPVHTHTMHTMHILMHALSEGLWKPVLCSKPHIGPLERGRTEEENLTYRSLNVNRTTRLSFFLFPSLLL